MKKIFFNLTALLLFIAVYVFAAEPVYVNSIGMEFVLVPAGSFMMGSDNGSGERRVRQVNITKTFYMGKYEVTQDEWYRIMGNNPAYFNTHRIKENSGYFPVENVSWYGAKEFIKRLNAEEGSDRYRLPTEAEWEYAAKGGANHSYFGSSTVGKIGWYAKNSDGKTRKAGTRKPNGYGIYDMNGNVREWVEDMYHENALHLLHPDDPSYTGKGSRRVVRGGSWIDSAEMLVPSYRSSYPSEFRSSIIGFRVVRTAD